MAGAHCGICLNHFSLEPERFAIFPCGHGFCTGCISRLCAEPRPKCPNCRVNLHKRDAHPVHIDFIDTQTFLRKSVVDGLNQMGADTPLISVKRATQKLGRISEGSEADIPLLVQAIEDFKERIIPVFTKVDTQKEEIDKLREDLCKLQRDKELLRTKLKKMGPLQAEIEQLKMALLETEQNTDEALRLAESAKNELATHHVTANQWKKRTTELEQENKRYRDMLDRHSNKARVQKEKNKKLSKQVTILTEKLAREKEALSGGSNEYDGDFSSHEGSRVHLENSTRAVSHNPSKSSRSIYCDENKSEPVLEGIPSANFPSDWQIDGPSVLQKRNLNGTVVSGQRRVANPFPISLDKKGYPTKAVHLGPRSLIHICR